ncbi:MAG: hypothetical protein ACRC4M_04210 [Mycoplasma sp.]
MFKMKTMKDYESCRIENLKFTIAKHKEYCSYWKSKSGGIDLSELERLGKMFLRIPLLEEELKRLEEEKQKQE